jgi:hypothetical protein
VWRKIPQIGPTTTIRCTTTASGLITLRVEKKLLSQKLFYYKFIQDLGSMMGIQNLGSLISYGE